MRLKRLLAVGSVALVAALTVTGVAMAGNRTKAPAKPAGRAVAMAPKAIAGASVVAARGFASQGSLAEAPLTNAPLKGSEQGGENEGSGENGGSGESDGPRGHQDPPGDVNHEFQGEE